MGQTLLITEGTALLGTRDGKVIVALPGEAVYTPPGEEHWHGAAPGTFMVHIALFEGTGDGGDGATWLEHVTTHWGTPSDKLAWGVVGATGALVWRELAVGIYPVSRRPAPGRCLHWNVA